MRETNKYGANNVKLMKTSATAAVMVVLVALAVLTSACTLGSTTGNVAKESGAGQGLEADAADANSSVGDGNVNGNGDADFCNFGLGVLKENSPKL